MPRLFIFHSTAYRYVCPVAFGSHRLLVRPRERRDLRLVDLEIAATPLAHVSWRTDDLGNAVADLAFGDGPASELRIDCSIVVDHNGGNPLEAPGATAAADTGPADDPARFRARSYADPSGAVDAWLSDLRGEFGRLDLPALAVAMTRTIHRRFTYGLRAEPGVQLPAETLRRRSGSCRDYAVLLIEAARALGCPARFVTGYLYDPAVDKGGTAMHGAGATHAWAQMFLPALGWVDFDPTNGIIGTENLIPVAVARDPAGAVPLQGTYFGDAGDFVDMSVQVAVSTAAPVGRAALTG